MSTCAISYLNAMKKILPDTFWVGACRTTGSISSGGTHMVQRDPCCWKWHSSSNQISRSSLTVSGFSFFISLLCFYICFGNERVLFMPAKFQFVKQTAILTFTHIYTKFFVKMMPKKLSIPKILRISQLTRTLAQILFGGIQHAFIQYSTTFRSKPFFKTSKTTLFKITNPVLNSSRTSSENVNNFVATEPRTYKQYSVQPMVISLFLGSHNFLLNCNSHNISIFYFKLAHNTISFMSFKYNKKDCYAHLFMSSCIK